MKQYRAGTFHKRVAYGQRERKLRLVARGILDGFKVTCPTETIAKNLAYSLRIRAERMTKDEEFRFGIKVRVDGRKVYAVRTKKHVT